MVSVDTEGAFADISMSARRSLRALMVACRSDIAESIFLRYRDVGNGQAGRQAGRRTYVGRLNP